MSFIKKLGETAKSTASSISSKSEVLIETGKLKHQRGKLESEIKDKKTAIGEEIYESHKQNKEADKGILLGKINEIVELESQIAEINDKLAKFDSPTCPACGFELKGGEKFCPGCGKNL